MTQLYSVCTHYQLIVAIQMKLSLFQNCEADIIINDHSVGYEKYADNLKSLGIFNNVYIAKTKSYTYTTSFFKKTKVTLDILLNNHRVITKLCDLKDFDYDCFYFNNYSCFNDLVYYQLKKRNPKLICIRFEEGYGSLLRYKIYTGSVKLQNRLEELHGNPRLDDIVDMYSFESECCLFDKSHNIIHIPKIKKDNLYTISLYNKVFDYSIKSISFAKKFIFFEESYFADGIDINDVELVLKIADLVGKENLMVKLHPRNPVDRFTKLGIKTIGQSGIPWEVIVMNHDFSNNIFITIASGSILSPRIVFGDNIPTFMLYNCINTLPPILKQKNFQSFIEKFRDKYGKSDFYIPDNFDDFKNIIRKRGL